MVVVRGRLTPEVGAVLRRALDAACEVLYERARGSEAAGEQAPTPAQQRAGALGERYEVVVHVDASALADPNQPGQSVLEDGAHVPAETSRRLACDASRVVMRHAPDGQVVEVGARTRTIPPALRRALQQRDWGCRFPGCRVRVGAGQQ